MVSACIFGFRYLINVVCKTHGPPTDEMQVWWLHDIFKKMLGSASSMGHPWQRTTPVWEKKSFPVGSPSGTASIELLFNASMTWAMFFDVELFASHVSLSCQAQSKVLLKIKFMTLWKGSRWSCRMFSVRIQQLTICSSVLLPGLNPDCSEKKVSASAWSLQACMQAWVCPTVCLHQCLPLRVWVCSLEHSHVHAHISVTVALHS